MVNQVWHLEKFRYLTQRVIFETHLKSLSLSWVSSYKRKQLQAWSCQLICMNCHLLLDPAREASHSTIGQGLMEGNSNTLRCRRLLLKRLFFRFLPRTWISTHNLGKNKWVCSPSQRYISVVNKCLFWVAILFDKWTKWGLNGRLCWLGLAWFGLAEWAELRAMISIESTLSRFLY